MCIYMYVGAFIAFMGEILPNHVYVDLSLVGTAASDSVQCHTDLDTCCHRDQGRHRGDWYFPDGDRLPFGADIYELRRAQRVYLYRRNNANTSGIYRCDIQTNTVHDDSDTSIRESVYVGLYTSGGEKWEEKVIVIFQILLQS